MYSISFRLLLTSIIHTTPSYIGLAGLLKDPEIYFSEIGDEKEPVIFGRNTTSFSN